MNRLRIPAVLLVNAVLVLLLTLTASAQSSGITVYASTDDNLLLTFNSSTPGSTTSVPITGLQAGETVQGIDIRPATGQLFALGSTGRLYIINPTTGVATPAGTSTFNPPLNGSEFGFDFNPTVDRIRLVSDADQDLRLNPNNGAVAAVDGTIAYSPTDIHAGSDPVLVASAYTNNFATSTSTLLFGIDSNLNVLVTQNPPNNGILNTVGSLGVTITGPVGFDIMSDSLGNDTAFASFNGSLWLINLGSGAATSLGTIGTDATVIGLAVTASVAPSSMMVPLCADFGGSTSPVVRADFTGAVANGGVFCRVLAENNALVSGGAAQIGVPAVLNRGVIQAVDVFVQGEGATTTFVQPAQVCLQGEGAFVFLSAAQSPRMPQDLPASEQNGYTCASIPNAGTVVLVRG
jgi:hypothetical protein